MPNTNALTRPSLRNRSFAAMLMLASIGASGSATAYDRPTGGRIVLGAIFPRLSPSGDSVAFSHQGSIWRMPRAGGPMKQLTVDEGFDVEPAWSPDESTIAYIRGRNSFAGRLHRLDAATARDLPWPNPISAKDRLYYHPDGDRLLGCFQLPGGRFAIAWLDVETGRVTKELKQDAWGQRFALSSRGDQIALATSQDIRGEQGGNNGPQCDLWIMPSSGGAAKLVTRFPGRVYELAWAADDRSLLVVSNVGGVHNDIWKVPLNSPKRGAEKLTFGQADEDSPNVSSDGRWMLYTNNRRGPTAMILRDTKDDYETHLRVSDVEWAAPAGILQLNLRDVQSGQPTTARVSVRRVGGKHHAPQSAIYRMLNGEMHFYVNGQASLRVPIGKYLVKAARGPEYAIARMETTVSENNAAKLTIPLHRWTNQRKRHWYSGESHIHANYGYGQWYNSPRTMLLQGAGEDLNVCNFMVANSEADGVFDREFFRGRPDPLSTKETVLYWNQEFRSTIWGHLTLLNLKQLVEPIFTGFAHTTNPHDVPTNYDIADQTHDQDGHVNYTHPAHNIKDPYLSAYSAKALPLDVALGKVDSIDVMGSNHVATMPLWYRLLNCGFQIPASAGTDCFLNRVRSRLPGQARVYVYVPGEFSYTRWVAALRAGKTFVTNGPMLTMQVNESEIGDTIELAQPDRVQVRGEVTSQYPLSKIEILYCGQVVETIPVNAEQRAVKFDVAVPIPRSGWVAVRAEGPRHADQPGGSVFGHTSPIYLHVASHPIQANDDVRYFIDWIERLRKDVRRRNRIPSRHQERVETQIAKARNVFNALLAK